MAKTVNDEFMRQVATEQAWKELAETHAWTEALLEKHSDKLDWKLISINSEIRWTIPMLKKFSDKLDWNELSEKISYTWFTEAHLEAFKDKWDWTRLVIRYQLSEELIDKYIDYIDWNSLIGVENYRYYNGLPRDVDYFDAVSFYERYKERISMSTFQTSELWSKIVNQRSKQLLAEILS